VCSGAFVGRYQNLEEVRVIACETLKSNVATFLKLRTDINEDEYPWLWEVKNEAQDAVLNSLPEMALSPEQLMQTLKDTRGETGVPFGRRLSIGSRLSRHR
jgi:hypothetical protein